MLNVEYRTSNQFLIAALYTLIIEEFPFSISLSFEKAMHYISSVKIIVYDMAACQRLRHSVYIGYGTSNKLYI